MIKTLSFVLPALSEIYGSHWEECMDILSSVFQKSSGGEEALPLLGSSFRLFSCLKSISEGDGNEDAQDAWAARKAGLFTVLASTIDTFGKILRLTLSDTCLICCRLHNHIPPTSGYNC